MRERLFGLETEYAFSVLDADGRASRAASALEALVRLAPERLQSLPGAGEAGIFLANGARFYLDAGAHPELATPECSSPAELVRYALAGDRILERLAAEVARRYGVAEVVLTRCNVDYGGSGASWGSHESQIHRASPAVVAAEIVPHLVSRIVYTGAGGFDSLANGVEFLVSPRVVHLRCERSASSMHDRGIYHVKDESLSGGGLHRLHVICGESTCSRLATYLKFGTTALVLAMIDAGLQPGSPVALTLPVRAMQRIARDPRCAVEVGLRSGGRASAIVIQRHYLARAEASLGAPFMPPWAEEVCRVWRATLDALEQGPDAVATRLDWAIKLVLFRRHAARRGFAWGAVERWSSIVKRLSRALDASAYAGATITAEEVLGARSPVADALAELTPALARAGLGWDGLRPFLDLRKELCEIDVRYSQLGARGIHGALERAAALDDGVDGVGDVEEAVATPPATGRARLRGEAIRALAGSAGCYAEWQGVSDAAGRHLDLSDPFATSAAWTKGGRSRAGALR